MAPEVLLNDVRNRTSIREKVPRPRRAAYSAAVDVWALGVIVYECLLREPPFDGPSEAAAIDAILDDKPELDASVLSARAIDFLSLCLAYNSGDRPSTVSLYEHAWVREPGTRWLAQWPCSDAYVDLSWLLHDDPRPDPGSPVHHPTRRQPPPLCPLIAPSR